MALNLKNLTRSPETVGFQVEKERYKKFLHS